MEIDKSAALASLIQTALANSVDFSNLRNILEQIGQDFGANGCVLWRERSRVVPDQEQCLYVLASWIQGGKSFAIYDLPFDGSISGEAIYRNATIIDQDIQDTKNEIQVNPELKQRLLDLNIQRVLAVPMTYRELDVNGQNKLRGALTLYRSGDEPNFNDDQAATLRDYSNIIPDLYTSLREKVSFKLEAAVFVLLGALEKQDCQLNDVEKCYDQVCERIAKTFPAIEVSIFLEDYLDEPGEFKLRGSQARKYIEKTTYRADKDDGFTGWILVHTRSIRIFRQQDFERDKKYIQTEYAELEFKDSMKLGEHIREYLNLGPDEPLPTISTMAAPILGKDKPIGVIRCTGTGKPHNYYFGRPDIKLLELVASRIAFSWTRFMNQQAMKRETANWKKLVSNLHKFNEDVLSELGVGSMLAEKKILRRVLRIANRFIEDCKILNLYAYDEKGRFLRLIGSYGHGKSGLKKDSPKEIKNGDDPHMRVLVSRKIQPYEREIGYANNLENRSVKCSFVLAPILIGDRPLGIIEFVKFASQPPTIQDLRAAELIAPSLGMYFHLAELLNERNKIQVELEESIAKQLEENKNRIATFRALWHQLRTPVSQLRIRSKLLLNRYEAGTISLLDTQMNLGLVRKVDTASQSMRLLADFQSKMKIDLKREKVSYEWLMKSLIELAADSELMLDKKKRLQIVVDRESIEKINQFNLYSFDRDFMIQMLNNLLDNAGKYSFARRADDGKYGVITISCHIMSNGDICVSVVNYGGPILPEEVKKCTDLGWRSNFAKNTTGEGSGIGLSLVKYIMDAHQGALEIIPTTSDGKTEIRLRFPKDKKS